MPRSIHEQIGEENVRRMNLLVMRLSANLDDFQAFVAGRNAATRAFANQAVPEELAEAVPLAQEQAKDTQKAHHIDTPEFALGSIMAAYVFRDRKD